MGDERHAGALPYIKGQGPGDDSSILLYTYGDPPIQLGEPRADADLPQWLRNLLRVKTTVAQALAIRERNILLLRALNDAERYEAVVGADDDSDIEVHVGCPHCATKFPCEICEFTKVGRALWAEFDVKVPTMATLLDAERMLAAIKARCMLERCQPGQGFACCKMEFDGLVYDDVSDPSNYHRVSIMLRANGACVRVKYTAQVSSEYVNKCRRYCKAHVVWVHEIIRRADVCEIPVVS